MTSNVETIIVALSSGGFFLLLRELLPGIWKWLTGRQRHERDLLQQAYRDLDAETRARRQVEEELHRLRTRVIQTGRSDLLLDMPQHMPTPGSILEPPQHRDTPPRKDKH